jgi:hypothetical protein
MNYREIAVSIKQSVSMRQVVDHYGFTPDRAGYIHCPFHAGDNQGSLKVYDGQGGFCCFGCGEKGSVIDFVMKLYDISFSSACKRISNDFSLDLPIGRQMTRREKEARKGAILVARAQAHELARKQTDIDQKFWAAFDLWCLADLMRIRYSPERTNGEILPGYANAVRELPLLADNLTQAEIERWKFEHTSSNPGMGKRSVSDTGAV